MEIPFIPKSCFQASPELGIVFFHLCTLPYVVLLLFFNNQKVIGVAGLQVGKCFDLGHYDC